VQTTLDKARVVRLTSTTARANASSSASTAFDEMREFRTLNHLRMLGFVPDRNSIDEFAAVGVDIHLSLAPL
jgi:hypothetical protein